MTNNFVPHCMSDAPPQIVALARHLAAGIREATVSSIREECPTFDERDSGRRDLVRGTLLIAANMEARNDE